MINYNQKEKDLPKRVLVYRIGGLGDSLLTYPVLEILSKQGWEVTVWGNPEYFELAKLAGFCQKVTFYEPKSLFDLHIFFTEKRELFDRPNSLFVRPTPKDRIWIVDYYLKSLNLEGYSYSKRLNLNQRKRDSSLCLIHPGSGSKRKNPEPELFRIIERRLRESGLEVNYILGPAERDLIGFFKEAFYFENIIEVSELLLSAILFIGLDSGISHLSSYLGTPSVVIYGPTDPLVWRPIGENVSVVRYNQCLPCYPEVCIEKLCLSSALIYKMIEEEVRKILMD